MKTRINEIKQIRMEDYNDRRQVIIQKHVMTDAFPLHWHNHYELEYILQGRGQHILNGKPYAAAPGVLHFLTPSDFHSITAEDSDSGMTLIKIYFEEADIDRDILQRIWRMPGNVVIPFQGAEKAMIDSLFSAAENSCAVLHHADADRAARKLLELILLCILNHLSNEAACADSVKEGAGGIRDALAYIQKNFRMRITLQDAAAHAHFSPTYFSKCFHRSVGISFQEYVQRLRLEFAGKLLLNSSASITDICYESGFTSLSTFINSFKRLYSLSPSEYRSKYQGGNQKIP